MAKKRGPKISSYGLERATRKVVNKDAMNSVGKEVRKLMDDVVRRVEQKNKDEKKYY